MAQEGLRPLKDRVADGLSGPSPPLLDAVAAGVGRTALGAIPSETRGWLQRPRLTARRSRDPGAVHAQRGIVAPESPPRRVAPVAARLPASRGDRRQGSAGPKGPSADAVARQRGTRYTAGRPARPVWLVSKRTVGAEPSSPYAIRQAPARPPLSPLVWLSGRRWAVAQGIAEGQTAWGMDHEEVRTEAGGHPHRLTTRLAHGFLGPLQLHVGQKSPGAARVTAAEALGRGVPLADGPRCSRSQGRGRAAAASSLGLSGA
jgi:hypothetical protein